MEPPPFHDLEVHPELRRFIRRMILTQTGPNTPHGAMIAPTGYAYVGWVFRGAMESFIDGSPHATFRSPCVFVGGALNHEWVRVDYSEEYGQILAEFTATGLYELLHVTGRKVAGIACPVEDLGLEEFTCHRDTSEDGQQDNRIAEVFQNSLRRFVPNARPAPAYVTRAVNMFESANGGVKVQQVAEAIGIRPDRLRRQFHKVVGLKPKSFLGALMFNHAMETLLGQNFGNLTELAHAAGYHDQAHFIRAVQKKIRKSPGDYLASPKIFPDALFVREPK